MRLSETLIVRTLAQYNGQAIPDDDPVVEELSELYGDHTFFLGGEGLTIVEPEDSVAPGLHEGRLIKLAEWNASHTALAPHEPEPTDVVIVLAVH